jgi:hypothetical protein
MDEMAVCAHTLPKMGSKSRFLFRLRENTARRTLYVPWATWPNILHMFSILSPYSFFSSLDIIADQRLSEGSLPSPTYRVSLVSASLKPIVTPCKA